MVRAGESDADRAVEVPMARDVVKAHTAAGIVASKARRRTILPAVIVVAEARATWLKAVSRSNGKYEARSYVFMDVRWCGGRWTINAHATLLATYEASTSTRQTEIWHIMSKVSQMPTMQR